MIHPNNEGDGTWKATRSDESANLQKKNEESTNVTTRMMIDEMPGERDTMTSATVTDQSRNNGENEATIGIAKKTIDESNSC